MSEVADRGRCGGSRRQIKDEYTLIDYGHDCAWWKGNPPMDVVLSAFAGVKRQGHRRKQKPGDLGDFLRSIGVRPGETGDVAVKIG